MEKEKNKRAPINVRKYWIRLSILFLLLLIPFRITIYLWDFYPEGNLTVWAYRLITLAIFLFGLKFIFTHKLRRHIFLTMVIIACLCASIYQTDRNKRNRSWHCTTPGWVSTRTGASEWDGVIFEPIWCSPHVLGACCWVEYVKIKYIPITIKADWFQNLSPNAGFQDNG